MAKYTVREAVIDAIKSIPFEKEFSGPDFHIMVLENLMDNESPKRPMDSTTTRTLRSVASLYGIKCVNQYRSLYKKCTL